MEHTITNTTNSITLTSPSTAISTYHHRQQNHTDFTHTEQNLGYGIGRFIREYIIDPIYYYFWPQKPTPQAQKQQLAKKVTGRIASERYHAFFVELQKRSRDYKTYDQLAKIVNNYLDNLLPYERHTKPLARIHNDIYRHLLELLPNKDPRYNPQDFLGVISRIPRLHYLLSDTLKEGLAYQIGVRSVSVEEDYRQLRKREAILDKTKTQYTPLFPPYNETEHQRLLKSTFPRDIIDAMGGLDKLKSLKVLDLGKSGQYSDHINYIRSKELKYNPMRGIDHHNRPFIAICYEQDGKETVEILFQRYTFDTRTWRSVPNNGADYDKELFFTRTRDSMTIFDYEYLTRFMKQEPCGVRTKETYASGSREKMDKEFYSKPFNQNIDGSEKTTIPLCQR